MKIDLEGRHVVVTGGTGELGAAVVELILGAGGTVHVPCRDPNRAERLSRHSGDRLRLTGGIDLGDERAVVRFYEGLPSLWASVHVAGGFSSASIEETTLDAFSRLMAMNGGSCFLTCREAVRAIRRTARSGPGGRGRIVNVAALPVVEPRRGAGMVAYAASKAVVGAVTTGLAEELAAEGIWVNAVAPSIMDTEANRAAIPNADPKKWAQVSEVAATILFLASPQNMVCRGGILPVFGRS